MQKLKADKREGIMKIRLATNIDGYLFEIAIFVQINFLGWLQLDFKLAKRQ